MHTQADTFRILSRRPFEEVRLQIRGLASAGRANIATGILKKCGWTRVEYQTELLRRVSLRIAKAEE